MPHFPVSAPRSLNALGQRIETTLSLRRSSEVQTALELRQARSSAQAEALAAHVLLDLGFDASSVTVAILLPVLAPAEAFPTGTDAATLELADSVRRLEQIRWQSADEQAAETLRRMFIALARDLRAVVLLLALRAEALGRPEPDDTPDEIARQLGQETLDVYAPLANRLGIWQLKWELENRALARVDPAGYQRIIDLLAQTQEQRDGYIQRVVAALQNHLATCGLDYDLSGRSKHVFSIYKKMLKKQVDFGQLYDVSAVRILVPAVADCYAILGLVHSLWSPLPGHFKDYIAMPKANGYQSLHTVVMALEGRVLEVQIRTRTMHELAEQGIAAHWAYKEQKSVDDSTSRFLSLRKLLAWEELGTQSAEFSNQLSTDLFEDQVYVFTPKGDVLALPKGATPLDFAYRVHTEVGHRCRGARVNDQIVALDYTLRNGDRVAVLTQKESRPRQDWLNESFGFLRTAGARAKVRQWFKEQGREAATRTGKEMVERELNRLDLQSTTLPEVVAALRYESAEDLFRAVGQGDKRLPAVTRMALELERASAAPELPPSVPPPARSAIPAGISLESIDGIAGNRAGCCLAVPGDDVIGFITRGRGVTVHRRDCAQIRETQEPERLVEISWGTRGAERFEVDLDVVAYARPNLIADLCHVAGQAGAEVVSARAQGKAGNAPHVLLGLKLVSAEQLTHVLGRLSTLSYVQSVRRHHRG